MKLVKFCINSCKACPHLQYKYNEDTYKYGYYCSFIREYIENKIDIRSAISENCQLEDCNKTC